jgi:hypothetical protein
MTYLFIAGWLVIVAAACVGAHALRIDRQLQRLLPALIERRWRQAIVRGEDASPWHWSVELLIPARWQRQLHSERGVALFDRMCVLVGLTLILLVVGFALLTASLELANAPGIR